MCCILTAAGIDGVNTWVPSEVIVTSGNTVIIEALRLGNDGQPFADIAIDELTITDGDCTVGSPSPSPAPVRTPASSQGAPGDGAGPPTSGPAPSPPGGNNGESGSDGGRQFSAGQDKQLL